MFLIVSPLQFKIDKFASYLLGFLEMIDSFSNTVGAKWCFRDSPYAPLEPVHDWNDGKELSETVQLSTLSPDEYNSIDSDQRQYYPPSACSNILTNYIHEKWNWKSISFH